MFTKRRSTRETSAGAPLAPGTNAGRLLPGRGAGDRPGRSFGATVAATATVLALLSGALVAVNLVQGMRLSFSEPDVHRLVSSSHQTLTLGANQQLEPIPASAITITPAAPFTVTTAANRLTISFDGTLAYGTEYEVEVRNIVGSFTTTPKTETTSFTTPAAAIVVLREGVDGDALVQVGVDKAGSERTLFEAADITDFAVSRSEVLVATADADPAERLVVVDLDGGSTRRVELPGDGYASDLDAVADYSLFGFRFDASAEARDFSWDRVLFVMENGGEPRAQLALDGEPLQAFDWMFVPAKPALVAQDLDMDLLLIDLRVGRESVPLGNYPDLLSAGNDGRTVVVGDALGMSRYDLTVGSVDPIGFDQPDGQIAYPSDALTLADARGVVRSFSVINPESHLFEERVTLEVDGTTRTLYTSATGGSAVVGVSTSPNDAYLALELAGSDGASETVVIDLASAREVIRTPGAGARWR